MLTCSQCWLEIWGWNWVNCEKIVSGGQIFGSISRDFRDIQGKITLMQNEWRKSTSTGRGLNFDITGSSRYPGLKTTRLQRIYMYRTKEYDWENNPSSFINSIYFTKGQEKTNPFVYRTYLGLLHCLSLYWIPPSHSRVHWEYGPHSDQPPSTILISTPECSHLPLMHHWNEKKSNMNEWTNERTNERTSE